MLLVTETNHGLAYNRKIFLKKSVVCNFFKSQRGLFPFILISTLQNFFQICTGSDKHCILLKKLLKNIGHRVNFRDIFKELNFERYVLGAFWLPRQQI